MKNTPIDNLTKKICFKIKFERIKQNLSQEELAIKANLTRGAIGKMERAEVSPTIESLEKIACALGIDFLDLVNVKKFDL